MKLDANVLIVKILPAKDVLGALLLDTLINLKSKLCRKDTMIIFAAAGFLSNASFLIWHCGVDVEVRVNKSGNDVAPPSVINAYIIQSPGRPRSMHPGPMFIAMKFGEGGRNNEPMGAGEFHEIISIVVGRFSTMVTNELCSGMSKSGVGVDEHDGWDFSPSSKQTIRKRSPPRAPGSHIDFGARGVSNEDVKHQERRSSTEEAPTSIRRSVMRRNCLMSKYCLTPSSMA